MEVRLDQHLANAAPLHPGADGQGVHGDGASLFLVADISALATEIAPVLREVHVLVGDGLAAAPGRNDVSEEHADGLVGPVRLNRFSCRESLDLPSIELVWYYGTEEAQAEFWACCESVSELDVF